MTRALALCLALFLFVHPAAAETITGRIVGVHDGDTVTLLDHSKRQIKIRLAEIDAPELGQPYGSRAKQELSALAFAKLATVDVKDIDRYGRTVGRITVEGIDINAEMVRQGAAWVYIRYNKDPSLIPIQNAARASQKGLWASPAPGTPLGIQEPQRHAQRPETAKRRNASLAQKPLKPFG